MTLAAFLALSNPHLVSTYNAIYTRILPHLCRSVNLAGRRGNPPIAKRAGKEDTEDSMKTCEAGHSFSFVCMHIELFSLTNTEFSQNVENS